jgi:23S rRNA (uracil1939-C5)-methyltransferase
VKGASASPAKPGVAPRSAAHRVHIEKVRIESLATGGDGVGRLASGAAVFVAGVAPGELVEAEVSTANKLAHGTLLRVLEASPDRVVPPCRYLDACGGCSFMHLTASAQERAHVAMVRGAVAHAVPGASLPEIVAHSAPRPLAYRTRARLLAKADRRGVHVGYRAASSHDLAAIDTCLVLDAALDPLLGDLAAVLAGAKGEGDASVARGRGGLPVVSLEWRGELSASTWSALDARVKSGAWAGAQVILHGTSLPAIFGDPRPVIEGVDGAPLLIAPGGFAQPSDHGASALSRRVDELSQMDPGGAPRPRHVVELFAGSGTLSVLLARGAASFTAVEVDAAAAATARHNLGARGLAGRVIEADADTFPIPANTSVLVLDPPRAGAPGAAPAIAASAARVVVYVACDPSTLARDLAVMTRGKLAITHVETFELFPQTSHVETVVRLARAR